MLRYAVLLCVIGMVYHVSHVMTSPPLCLSRLPLCPLEAFPVEVNNPNSNKITPDGLIEFSDLPGIPRRIQLRTESIRRSRALVLNENASPYIFAFS